LLRVILISSRDPRVHGWAKGECDWKLESGCPVNWTRRSFLISLTGLAGAALGCSFFSPTPITLDDFMTLSRGLTAQPLTSLSDTGQVYLQAFNASPPSAAALSRLYHKSGMWKQAPPASFAELEQSGIFSDPDTAKTADAVITCWYSGVYQTASGPAVATFHNALGWTTLGFTTAKSWCHGAWWEKPFVPGSAHG